jgi:ATP-binding cassette subfamily F protein 3
MLLVSHDEYLVSRIANRIFEMRPGRFRDFPGTLTDYRSYIEEGYLAPLEALDGDSAGGQVDAEAQKRERLRRKDERKRLDRRIEKAEREIARLEGEMAKCRQTLESPANATQYQLLSEAQLELGQFGDEHERVMTEWHGLQEELESVGGVE